ncbi:MAG: putative Ig domain-containing protein [Planctomycetota bacterium]
MRSNSLLKIAAVIMFVAYITAFNYGGCGGGGGSSGSSATVANRAPVLSPIGNQTIAEGATLTLTITGTDPDGDTLTYSASSLPLGATFDATTHTFSWTPAYNKAGTYTGIKFKVTDPTYLAAEETITITVTDVTAPNEPSNLTATAISPSQINLQWADNSANEDSFKIERKTGSGGTYEEIVSISTDSSSYSNTGLSGGTTYYYRVRAYNPVGYSSYSNEANAATLFNPPAPVTLPTPADGATDISLNQQLSWTAITGATSYDVYFGITTPPAYVTNTAVTSYNPGVLSNNIIYYWRIDSKNSGGTTTGIVWNFQTIKLFAKDTGNPVFEPAAWCPWDCSWYDAISVISDTVNNQYKMWYWAYGLGDTLLGYATSNNGTTWTKSTNNPLMSIPIPIESNDMQGLSVIKDDSTYKMWYGINDVGLTNGEDRIYYATSTDGETWTSPNTDSSAYPVFSLPLSHTLQACFVILDGTTYRMWYYVRDQADWANKVYYATSADGLAWTMQNSGNPVMIDVSVESDVIKDGSSYKIWGRNMGQAKVYSSSDGITWTPTNSNHLGSPTSSIINEAGTYKRWYDVGSRVHYATSSDGLTWTDYSSNPIIPSSALTNPESHGLWPGSIVKDGTTYKMWYEYRGDGPFFTDIKFGYATSSDGVSWTRYGSNPVLTTGFTWDGYGISDPVVILDGSTYKMWYYGYGFSFMFDSGIGYATSSDGITWTKYGTGPVLVKGTSEWFNDFSIIKGTDGIYRMWFERIDSATGVTDIRYAYSADGITWTRESNPVLSPGAAGSWDETIMDLTVILDGAIYRLWYAATSLTGGIKIGEATSPDGINWTKLGPVLSPSSAGNWDSASMMPACAILDGTTYKLWYIGTDSKGYQRVGLATR